MTDNIDSKKQWEVTCLKVMNEMKDHVAPFITPISKVISHEEGEPWGSGSYFTSEGKRFLITNEHVARVMKTHSIAHQFFGSTDVFRLSNSMPAVEYPNDVALSVIEDSAWGHSPNSAVPIPIGRFATTHRSVAGELFFIAGYSGERSRFSFGTLVSRGTPYLTQEIDVPDKCGDPQYHFALHYLPDKAVVAESGGYGLPNPHGFSGSLVWNTRYLETIQRDGTWTPDCAQVTGIVWGWPSGAGCLVATKVEQMELTFLMNKAKNPRC